MVLKKTDLNNETYKQGDYISFLWGTQIWSAASVLTRSLPSPPCLYHITFTAQINRLYKALSSDDMIENFTGKQDMVTLYTILQKATKTSIRDLRGCYKGFRLFVCLPLAAITTSCPLFLGCGREGVLFSLLVPAFPALRIFPGIYS